MPIETAASATAEFYDRHQGDPVAVFQRGARRRGGARARALSRGGAGVVVGVTAPPRAREREKERRRRRGGVVVSR
jgi:hypothetical protein